MIKLNYTVIIVRNRFTLNRDHHGFDWKVPIGVSTLHEFVRHDRHKADIAVGL